MSFVRTTAGVLLMSLTALMAGSLSFAAGPSFSPGVSTGTVQNAAVIEASGIVASRMNPNVLWTRIRIQANPNDGIGTGGAAVQWIRGGDRVGWKTEEVSHGLKSVPHYGHGE